MLKSETPSRILFLFSGSIACYKACHAISQLVQSGHTVKTGATVSALKFIGPSTLEGLTGLPVSYDLYQEGHQMDHIHLARNTDLMILCPASANSIARLANGVADDLVSALFLANNFKKPFLVAPAMNSEMYKHPATQSNLARLKEWGAEIVEGAEGPLACGEYGAGRLAEPQQIIERIELALSRLQK